jgi:hypothetical protein
VSRAVILVEGRSDKAALEVLAGRLGVDLGAEGVAIEAMGGATNIRRFAALHGPRVFGLCDEAERPDFVRAGVDPFVCVADLEDELIRALGVPTVEEVIASLGETHRLRIFRQQPAQRGRAATPALRRFIATRSGAKLTYARALTSALELSSVPSPLAGVLAASLADCPA